jgi:hypothetical protein
LARPEQTENFKEEIKNDIRGIQDKIAPVMLNLKDDGYGRETGERCHISDQAAGLHLSPGF